jgi:hypothetical protein
MFECSQKRGLWVASQFLPSGSGKFLELSSQTNLAEVASLSQIVKGLSQLRETKDPIHQALDCSDNEPPFIDRKQTFSAKGSFCGCWGTQSRVQLA